MNSSERADLGFSEVLAELDIDEWQPKKPNRRFDQSQIEDSNLVAEASGFKSREPKARKSSSLMGAGQGGVTPPRRRRTGRNAQFNLKAKPETIEAYCFIADQQGWGLGETLERAVELLQREYSNPHS